MNAALVSVMILGAIVSLATFVFGFLYAFANRRRSSMAAKFVFGGLCSLASGWVVGYIVPMVVAQVSGPAAMGSASMWMNLFSSITFAIGIGLLVVGAFVDRNSIPTYPNEFLPGCLLYTSPSPRDS